MAHSKVASRYAKAILEFLSGTEAARAMVGELKAFHEATQSHPELKHVLTTALFSSSERRGVVEDVVKRSGLSEKTLRVLLVLSEAKRLASVESIANELNFLLVTSAGIIPLDVVAAYPVSPDDQKKLEQKFVQVLGKKVEATYRQDASVMGGVKVSAAGRTFDGTLSGWLSSMEESLMGGSL